MDAPGSAIAVSRRRPRKAVAQQRAGAAPCGTSAKKTHNTTRAISYPPPPRCWRHPINSGAWASRGSQALCPQGTPRASEATSVPGFGGRLSPLTTTAAVGREPAAPASSSGRPCSLACSHALTIKSRHAQHHTHVAWATIRTTPFDALVTRHCLGALLWLPPLPHNRATLPNLQHKLMDVDSTPTRRPLLTAPPLPPSGARSARRALFSSSSGLPPPSPSRPAGVLPASPASPFVR